MIVYVESNFVLEIALGQEQSQAAEGMLRHAEAGSSDLRYPEFSLAEPFATITERGRARRRLTNTLEEQVRQLSRSRPHRQDVIRLQPAPLILASIEKREIDLLQSAVERLLRIGTSLTLDLAVFQRATSYQARYGLSPQDSLIYASIVEDLERQIRSEPKLFVSRNWRDFRDPGLVAELQAHGCTLVTDFAVALSHVHQP